MPKRHAEPLRNLIHRLTCPGGNRAPDADLLDRFRKHRDEAAFAALVERHGPMVLGVCRRVLGDDVAAEDAFQATFLVLARKAGAVGRPEQLANWLYGVAWRTAAHARVSASRRRVHERRAAVPEASEPANGLESRELRTVLDEELHRLSAKDRAAVVLCYLEGNTQEEAAERLGWSKGAVRGRLERAREKLRLRLSRRGVVISAGALSTALAVDAASASVPATLAQATVRGALMVAAGLPVAGLVSENAIALTRKVLRAMIATKLKLAAVTLLSLGTVMAGGRIALSRAGADKAALAVQTQTSSRPDIPTAKPANAPVRSPTPDPLLGAVDERVSKIADINEKLDQPVRAGPFEQGTRLLDALQNLSDRFNVTILVDDDAFKKQDSDEIYQMPVRLPLLVDLKFRAVLRRLLRQVGADFLAQEDFIRIVPRERIASGANLAEPVDVALKSSSLSQAFEKLSQRTGVSIVLDEQVAPNVDKAPLTLRLGNVPLATAVAVLADMRGLKTVTLENLIYVTTADKAFDFRAMYQPLLRGLSARPAAPSEGTDKKEGPKEKKGQRKKV